MWVPVLLLQLVGKSTPLPAWLRGRRFRPSPSAPGGGSTNCSQPPCVWTACREPPSWSSDIGEKRRGDIFRHITLLLRSMKYEVWSVIGLCIGSQLLMSKKYQVNLFLFIRKFQIHIKVFWSSVFMAHIWKKVHFHQISIVLVEMAEQAVGTAST